MLGGKKAGQLGWKSFVDEVSTVAQFAVRRCLIAEQTESAPRKPLGWRRKKLLDSQRDHMQ